MMVFRLISYLSLLIIGIYVVLSFVSALRMLTVHGRYVHIEYAAKAARSGTWAPKRVRLLRRWQWLSVFALAALVCSTIAPLLGKPS